MLSHVQSTYFTEHRHSTLNPDLAGFSKVLPHSRLISFPRLRLLNSSLFIDAVVDRDRLLVSLPPLLLLSEVERENSSLLVIAGKLGLRAGWRYSPNCRGYFSR